MNDILSENRLKKSLNLKHGINLTKVSSMGINFRVENVTLIWLVDELFWKITVPARMYSKIKKHKKYSFVKTKFKLLHKGFKHYNIIFFKWLKMEFIKLKVCICL